MGHNFLLRIFLLALSIYLVGRGTRIFHVDSFFTAIIAAIVLALVNTFVRPIIVFLTLPFTIITFGLFLFLVNGLSLLIVSAIVPKFKVHGCVTSATAALLISLANMLLEWILI